MLIIETKGENIATPPYIYICFRQRSINNINYINTSVMVYNKSAVALLSTHTSP